MADTRTAHQPHVAFDFGTQLFERALHAGLTGSCERIQIIAPETDGFCSHCRYFQDMRAAKAVVLEAVDFATTSPEPEISELYTDVYA